MKLGIRGGKVMLDFKLQKFEEGIRDEETKAEIAPPHWRMVDPNGSVYCYGYLPSFEGMVALMRLAKLGARLATREQLVTEGVIAVSSLKPRIHIADADAMDIDREAPSHGN